MYFYITNNFLKSSITYVPSYIMKFIINTVYALKYSQEVALFKSFQQYQSLTDRNKYELRIPFVDATNLVEGMKQEMIKFAKKQKKNKEIKLGGDYEEFLELVFIFLSSLTETGVKFMSPGAMQHASWMSKMIIDLKIQIFNA